MGGKLQRAKGAKPWHPGVYENISPRNFKTRKKKKKKKTITYRTWRRRAGVNYTKTEEKGGEI